MTEEKKQQILENLKLRYNFDESGLFGASTLSNYLERNNQKIVEAVNNVVVGNFRYKKVMKRKRKLTLLYYKTFECNKGVVFSGAFRDEYHKILNKKIMDYIRKFTGITSWKGFIETTKILDKEYVKSHPNSLFRWAEPEEIDSLIDSVWDAIYEVLDNTGFYIREAEEFLISRQ